MTILGYLRPDGQIGIRNKVAIIYSVHCSMYVAQKIQRLFPEHTQLFGYPGGCAMRDEPVNKIVALGKHSQFGAALVVGLGCEGAEAHGIAARIAESGKPAVAVKINEEGGDIKTVEKGSRLMLQLLQHTSVAPRVPLAPADLIVGAECGGSDATSGLASNPIVGAAADLLIEAGGTYMHSETSELLGCADVLAARAVDAQAAADIRAAIEAAERASFEHGRFSWGYGNILGGLTSIEEKS
ncbi:MAG: UxaA family hydrolase, partial [Chloroflexota bacterium]